MSKPDDGGPAFPCITSTSDGAVGQANDPGMSLLDFFAGQALPHIIKLLEVNNMNLTPDMIAEWSYDVAEAMISEKHRREGT